MKIARSLVLVAVFLFSAHATVQAACSLPATGQTTCWNTSGTVIPCAGTGQDGELQKGTPLSYTDNGDGTITDSNTGLMWEKMSEDSSVHDITNMYLWSDAFAHVGTLNTMAFAGHSDWRVPNMRELQSIVDYENSASPTVASAFNTNCSRPCTVTMCSCTAARGHWTATTFADSPVWRGT